MQQKKTYIPFSKSFWFKYNIILFLILLFLIPVAGPAVRKAVFGKDMTLVQWWHERHH